MSKISKRPVSADAKPLVEALKNNPELLAEVLSNLPVAQDYIVGVICNLEPHGIDLIVKLEAEFEGFTL